MPIRHKESYTVYNLADDTEQSFPSLALAQREAERLAGNGRFTKPFPKEDTFIYGPGDGSSSVMIRRDVEFVP